MLRYEYDYPYCSCYTEPDVRFMAAKSRSLTFDREKFKENSYWMGVKAYGAGEKFADAVESRYYVEPYAGYRYPHCGVGTASYNVNLKPFFLRTNNEVTWTMRAYFAGREHDRRGWSLYHTCDIRCYKCGVEDPGDYSLEYVLLDFNSHRFEVLCRNCYMEWVRERKEVYGIRHRTYMLCDTKDQISLARFILT